ncbi:MAG TPA: hypothetical protein VG125_07105 [Pirellulales bacterium]|jgi:hypothetical protein|nr:hypothetical protein [Pirellulales bacterium]
MTQHIPNPPLGPYDRQDSRGRVRTFLGLGHPYANSAGWQWRSRLVVMQALGRRLGPMEHVHHVTRNRADDRLEQLEVLACEYHQRLHAFAVSIYRQRDGRWGLVPEPATFDWPRAGAVLGPAARQGGG